MVACALLSVAVPVHAQQFSLGISTIHDENIFDVYVPIADQLTQLQLDVSKDWDLDHTTLGLSYTGTGMVFRDLPSRGYHAHALSCSASHQFTSEEDGEDSASVGTDSTAEAVTRPEAGADSLDRFLYGSMFAGSQFNQDAFAEYNNIKLAGQVSLRQPLGAFGSATPSYALSYHAYPNLEPVTNIQHMVALTFGGAVVPGAWLFIAPAYGVKSYPSTSTYTLTVSDILTSGKGPGGNGSGHGKGGGSGAGGVTTRSTTFTATSPSVRQLFITVGWQQRLRGGPQFSASYTRYADPSSGARLIPQLLQNIIDVAQGGGVSASQNEILDDHFSYRGSEFKLRVDQPLPLVFSATAEAEFHGKTFTSPAMDLSDTVQLADHREDSRAEFGFSLVRPVKIGGRTLEPHVELRFIRNSSNAPFYDFDKTSILVGIEYTF